MVAAGLIALGLSLLVVGAEFLVRGATNLARAFGVSNLVVGLTVVSAGTSAPELAVCVQAAFAGSSDISAGNVIGSNIANVFLILALTAIVYPVTVDSKLLARDLPIMVAVSVVGAYLMWDSQVSRIDGAIFLAGFAGYSLFTYKMSVADGIADEAAGIGANVSQTNWPIGKSTLAVIVGVAGLVFGADWFVAGAKELAMKFGISDRVIGLTLVAFGTSLPELATSLVAAFKKESDIVMGNIVGSNLFNILLILGTASVILPIDISRGMVQIDLPIMLAVAFFLWLAAWRRTIARAPAGIMLTCYVGYILYLFRSSSY